MLARAVAEKGVDPDTLVLGDVLRMNVSTDQGEVMERQISAAHEGSRYAGSFTCRRPRRQGLADLEDVPRRPVGHGFNPNLSADAALLARAAVRYPSARVSGRLYRVDSPDPLGSPVGGLGRFSCSHARDRCWEAHGKPRPLSRGTASSSLPRSGHLGSGAESQRDHTIASWPSASSMDASLPAASVGPP